MITFRYIATIPARMTPANLLYLTLALFALGAVIIALNACTGGNIPPPPPANISLASQDLHKAIETSHLNQGRTSLTYRVTLDQADQKRFKLHFQNIAPSKGWYPHSLDQYGIRVVLPAEDLTELRTAADNPVTWVSQYTRSDQTPKPPSTLNLVNVQLRTDARLHSVRNKTLFAATALCWITGLVAIFTAVYRCHSPYRY